MPPPPSHQIHPLPLHPPSLTKNYKLSNIAKLTGPATSDKPLYLQTTLALMRHVSIATAWDTSGSTASFTPAPLASITPPTIFKIVAHSVTTIIRLVPYLLRPLHPTTPLLPQDQFTQCLLLWQTDFPPPLLDGLSMDLVALALLLHTSTLPPSSFVVFVLPSWILTTMTSMTPMPGETSMAIRVFQQCLNATMGVMLPLPISFSFLFVLLCFPLVLSLVGCSIPAVHISFTSFYPHDLRSNCFFLEYSLQNIPLYYQHSTTFFHLLFPLSYFSW